MAANSKKNALVGIVMGSASDSKTMLLAKQVLDEFGVLNEVRVMSAHRTPKEVVSWAESAAGSGIKVVIAAAGLAAHLAGVVSAHTILPVIGCPMDGGPLNGVDALLSTVQMPKGIPVASLAIGKAGAVNAALFAIRILALSDNDLQQKLMEYQKKLKDEVLSADLQMQVSE